MPWIPVTGRRLWLSILNDLFPSRRKSCRQKRLRPGIRPRLVELESRLAPTVGMFTPASGEELRSDIIAAAGDTNAQDIFTLAAGTYALTDNIAGHILIQNTNGTVPNKTFTIVGAGAKSTLVEPGVTPWNDRVFQVEGSNVTVQFEKLAITKGSIAEPLPDVGNSPLVAQGGGLLIDGGDVTLSNAAVTGNKVKGAPGRNGNGGAAGQAGTDGIDGGAAQGGGIYLVTGTLKIVNSTIAKNQAVGGNGGAGGAGGAGAAGTAGASGSAGSDGQPSGNGQSGHAGGSGKAGVHGANGGNGGNGSVGAGGGIFVQGGTVTINTNSTLTGNAAMAGAGGVGGQGGAGGAGGIGGAGGGGGKGGAGAVGLDTNPVGQDGGHGGNGGAGAPGGNGAAGSVGGSGGRGGDGGNGQGGALYVAAGSINITTTTITSNTASGNAGGAGGVGGNGGAGGNGGGGGGGGSGGRGGSGGHGSKQGGNGGLPGSNGDGAGGGQGGNGGDAGIGGAAGQGGVGAGGGFYIAGGSLTLGTCTLATDVAQGGAGGAGGAGGVGGNGGAGGQGGGGGNHGNAGSGANGPIGGLAFDGAKGGSGGDGGNGGAAGKGNDGGPGGNGGLAFGGGIYQGQGTLVLAAGSISGSAIGGKGGVGGAGGVGGVGGFAGGGGAGGIGGSGGCGGGNATKTAAGGNGGNGGRGGDGGNGGHGGAGGYGGHGGDGGFGQGGSLCITNGSAYSANGTTLKGTALGGAPGLGGKAGAAGAPGGLADGGTGGRGGGTQEGSRGNHPHPGTVGAVGRDGVKPGASTPGHDGFPGLAGGTGGDSSTGFFAPVTVTLVPPTPVEGAALQNILVATFTDGDPLANINDYTVNVAWGDGQVSSTGTKTVTIKADGAGFDVMASKPRAYAEEVNNPKTLTFSVTVSHPKIATDTKRAKINVADVPLTLTASPSLPSFVEGQPVKKILVGTFTDADPKGTASDYTAVVNWGDADVSTTAKGNVSIKPDAKIKGLFDIFATKPHPYGEETGGLTLSVAVTDAGGAASPAKTTSVSVVDAPLNKLVLLAPKPVEGEALGPVLSGHGVLVATFQDGDPLGAAGDYSATVVWGDGETSTTGSGNVFIQKDPKKPGVFDILAAKPHPYAEEGKGLTFKVTVTDQGGAPSLTSSLLINVADAPLTLTLKPLAPAKGQALSQVLVATFTDPGFNGSFNVYTVTVAWGDGETSTTGPNITVKADPVQAGVFDILASKKDPYAKAAKLTFKVSITDDGGAAASKSESTKVT